MNLLEQLKPEYKELLKLESEKYPNMCQSTIKMLTEKEFYFSLTLSECATITTITGTKIGISEIKNLFTNE
jgi:hypothetical protein